VSPENLTVKEPPPPVAVQEGGKSLPIPIPANLPPNITPEQVKAFLSKQGAENFVILNFDDAELADVINTISSITGANFIVSPGLSAKITINSSKKIPISEVLNVFESILDVNGISLVKSGDFFKMVKYAKSKGIVVTTVTNGNLMNEKKVDEILDSGLDRMYVSIDSLNREQYAKYRPGGNLDVVKKNLEHLMAVRKKSGNSINIGIWMLLFKDNFNQLIPMIEFAKSLGVNELIINPEITDRGKEDWKEIISAMKITKKKISNKIITKAIIEAREAGMNVSIAKGMGVMKSTPEAICEWPWKSLYVDTEGNISPCCIIADAKVMGMGNILKCDFDTIWNSQKYRQFRKQHLSEKIPDICKACYKKN